MNDLRKAAEMAWKYFEDAHGLEDEEVKYLTSHFDWRAPKEQFVPVIEARLKEKNT